VIVFVVMLGRGVHFLPLKRMDVNGEDEAGHDMLERHTEKTF